jgi:hypothetical protein
LKRIEPVQTTLASALREIDTVAAYAWWAREPDDEDMDGEEDEASV